MNTIEAPLTAILIVICLGFMTYTHFEKIKLDKEKLNSETNTKKLIKKIIDSDDPQKSKMNSLGGDATFGN